MLELQSSGLFFSEILPVTHLYIVGPGGPEELVPLHAGHCLYVGHLHGGQLREVKHPEVAQLLVQSLVLTIGKSIIINRVSWCSQEIELS